MKKVTFDMDQVTDADAGVLMEYVEDQITGQRAGVLVAKRAKNGVPRIGWAFAHTEKGDKFDRDFGLFLAFQRIERDRAKLYHPRFEQDVQRFCERAHRYFKTLPEFPGDQKRMLSGKPIGGTERIFV